MFEFGVGFEFAGTSRYEILRRLGSGGMGVVYAARDRDRADEIALKTLRHLDSQSIYLLKEEFRSLCSISHRNLVALYEMERDSTQWFFTMELVAGQSLYQYLRSDRDAASMPTTEAMFPPSNFDAPRPLPTPPTVSGTAQRDALAIERLRPMLVQLATGIAALHTADKLHRDIKPSNVMIETSGRVVLLDFGLVTEVQRNARASRAPEPQVVGTPEYMAPDQAMRRRQTYAADWYSFGVILYEVLTGHLPFRGNALDILVAKQQRAPVAPRVHTSDVPEDLESLCMQLLERDPLRRPAGVDVIERLSNVPTDNAWHPVSSSYPASAFVGRSDERAVLEQAFEDAGAGRTMTVRVQGPSGVGKTALVRNFLDDVARGSDALILDGRCYERESVPFKAVDAIVDRLTDYWCSLGHDEAEALVPDDVGLCAQMFEVLSRVRPVERRSTTEVIGDAHEHRRRALDALIDVIRRVCQRRFVVMFIDDLQWGDLDSASIFSALMGLGEGARLLLIHAYRSEDRASSPLLSHFDAAQVELTAQVRTIDVEPLSIQDACSLAQVMLGQGADEALARRIAVESHGSPWFVHELVRLQALGHNITQPSIDRVVGLRLERLSNAAARLLETVSIAGRPIDVSLALEATGPLPGLREADTVLRSMHLVAARGGAQAELLEAYHDRIREAVVSRMSPSRKTEVHRAVAAVLLRQPSPNPEVLLDHFSAAGDGARAYEYAVRAARRANAALAFERASRLYRVATDLAPDDVARVDLGRKLAEALINAGRGAEAGQELEGVARHLRAADASEDEILRVEQRAAEQYLKSGRVERGVQLLRQLTAAIGEAMPEPTPKVLSALAIERTRLAVRGLRYERRSEHDIAARDLLRTDLCSAAYVGLSFIDPLLAAYFQVRWVNLALDLGEPARLARSLAAEAVYNASVGGRRGRRRFAKLMRRAEELAERAGDPYTRASTMFQKGWAAYLEAQFRRSFDLQTAAMRVLREQCTGVGFEAASYDSTSLSTLAHLGEISELARRLPGAMRDADERGDLYASTVVRMGGASMAWLAADQPDRARDEANAALSRWPSAGFQMQHYAHLVSTVGADLYAGRAESAYARVVEAWPRLTAAHLARLQILRIESTALRARAALAAASASGGPAGLSTEALLARAESDATHVAGNELGWAAPLSAALMAGVHAVRGQEDSVVDALVRAAAGFDAVDMGLHATCARYALGVRLGGDEGTAKQKRAERTMMEQGILRPEAIVTVLFPGVSP